MNWFSVVFMVVFVGLSAGLAALIATILVQKPSQKRLTFSALFLVLLGVFSFGAHKFLQPEAESRVFRFKAEREFAQTAAYRTIKKHHPEIYEAMMSDYLEGKKAGKTPLELASKVREHMIALVEKSLPQASDQSVVAYTKIAMLELDDLMQKDGDMCFYYLYPDPSKPTDFSRHLPAKRIQDDLDAVAEVIRTAAEKPQAVPTESDIEEAMTPIYTALGERYGEAVLAFEKLDSPDLDRRQICSMTAWLFQEILKLPEEQSGKAIRALLASS